jgi:hypothetical protein
MMLQVLAGQRISRPLSPLRQASETMATGVSAILCKPTLIPTKVKTTTKVRMLIFNRNESLTLRLAALERSINCNSSAFLSA